MSKSRNLYVFDDPIGRTPPGHVFFPESLTRIKVFLGELLGEKMEHPRYFNANIRRCLDTILGYFQGIRDFHAAAAAVQRGYRSKHQQYCLYLRSFFLAGGAFYEYRGDADLRSYPLHSSADWRFRHFTTEALSNKLNRLSFFNLHDVYPPADQNQHPSHRQTDFPSFRVLSHNWKAAVREAIRGAKLIVFHLTTESEGVAFGLETIRECNMATRTVAVGETLDDRSEELSDFHSVIALATTGDWTSSAASRQLQAVVASLARDGFARRPVPRLHPKLPAEQLGAPLGAVPGVGSKLAQGRGCACCRASHPCGTTGEDPDFGTAHVLRCRHS